MDHSFKTPVTLIIFNRPDYTRQLFEVIRKIRPEKLFLISDGARNKDEEILLKETRQIFELIDWPCEVLKNFSETNLGVRKRIESGINWVFEYTDKTIILEDDCIPDPSFFEFASLMLIKYESDNRIMMISGDNPVPKNAYIFEDTSYVFSRYFAIWGWATWKRAWQKYDYQMQDWSQRKKENSIFNKLKHKGAAKYLTDLFDKAYKNEINSWATRWFYTCLFEKGLSIVPSLNLVSNIGVKGVHDSPGQNNNVKSEHLEIDKLKFPNEVAWSEDYDKVFFDLNFKKNISISGREFILKAFSKIKKVLIKIPFIGKKIELSDLLNPYNKTHLLRKIIFKLTGVISLFPPNISKKNIKGYILLSYITSPFLRPDNNPSINHTNEWECMEIARIFIRKGYGVDVIEWNNRNFKPKKKYNAIIDIHENIERLITLLPKECKKIFHITGAHFSFMNKAEEMRLHELKARRGISLNSRRKVPETKNVEHSDILTSLGNKFTFDTYAYAHKPLYPIPISTPLIFDFPKNRNLSKAKNNFIWFGGTGFVHKGLDLVLEAFSNMPQYRLTVIGPISKEKDFESQFYKELYETPNIKTLGWLSIESNEFKDATQNAIAIVYPSCSEGGGGSVITAMHRGLIPIVTYESSVNIEDFGILMKKATINDIMESVKLVANMSDEELNNRSLNAWKYAQKHHTKESFSKAFEEFANKILS